MKDNLEACNLWDIVTGVEKRPDEYYVDDVKLWVRREKIARIVIKNLLGPKDYLQVQYLETVTQLWTTLMELHQSTGALYKVELMWKFWGMRYSEGASVREHLKEKDKKSDSKVFELSASEQSAQAVEDDLFMAAYNEMSEDLNMESIHFTSSPWSQDSWIVDSGTSTHIANQREMFTDYYTTQGTLNVAVGLTAKIEGNGSIIMQNMLTRRKKVFKLSNVLQVPTTRHCLLSGPRLDQSGGRAEYGNVKCRFWNAKGDLLTTGVLDGNLYQFDAKASVSQFPTVNQISIPALSWHDAHKRLGHISLTSLKFLLNNKLLEGFEIDKSEEIPLKLDCESCILAKAHRASFSKRTDNRTSAFGDLTHTDVWGSVNVKNTPGGNKYFILFIDDYTRYTTVKFMKDKASIKQQLINYCTFVNTQKGHWPKEIRADNAAEYQGTRD
ncbi:hypothetical protein K3495_g8834 [Podosphaera aphanis]|nr:hypothetical protein K3495_g8834 [Podosphaera aphanis]